MTEPEKDLSDLCSEFWKQVHEAHRRKAKKPVVGTGNFKKKVVSESLGVHPRQIPEAIEFNKKHGVSVDFDKHGRPIFDNSAHFRRYLKVRGMRHYGY